LEPTLKVVYGVAAVCMIFWTAVLAAQPALPIKQVVRTMLRYPNFYDLFLQWYVKGWPILTAIVAVGCIMLAVRFLSDRSDPVPLFILGAIFVAGVLPSFSRTLILEARYTFHLYPLIVMVFAFVVVEVGSAVLRRLSAGGRLRPVVVAVAMALVLFISQDANPVNAWSVGNRTYQSAKDPIRTIDNWKFYTRFHQDYKSPSFYVRERLTPGDRVIVLGPPHKTAIYYFYVGRVDYAVRGSIDLPSYTELREGKVIDYVTGCEVLKDLSDVKEIMEGHLEGGTWLLGDRMLLVEDNDFYSNQMKEYLRSLTRNLDYLGRDAQTFAVKVR
jgi:hypothetical protein